MYIYSSVMLISILSFFNSQQVNSQEAAYEYVHYETRGGPSIDFRILPTEKKDLLKINLKHYRHIHKEIQIELKRSASNEHIFDIFHKVISNTIEFKKDATIINSSRARPTGSFTYIYAVSGNEKEKISNPEIVSILHQLRQIVTEELKKE